MKQGNQFYLDVQIYDENDSLLDIDLVSKVQFNIGILTKTYDGVSEEVVYDKENNTFKVWIYEEESFEFDTNTKMDARILFNNDSIEGTFIEPMYVYNSLNKVNLDDETKNTEQG